MNHYLHSLNYRGETNSIGSRGFFSHPFKHKDGSWKWKPILWTAAVPIFAVVVTNLVYKEDEMDLERKYMDLMVENSVPLSMMHLPPETIAAIRKMPKQSMAKSFRPLEFFS